METKCDFSVGVQPTTEERGRGKKGRKEPTPLAEPKKKVENKNQRQKSKSYLINQQLEGKKWIA